MRALHRLLRLNVLIFFFILLGALFIRSIHYPVRVNFSTDQGVFGIRAHEIWKQREITLIGPRTSFEYQGRVIFQSSVIYYVYLFFLLIGGFQPVAASYAFTLFAVIMLVPLALGLYLLKGERAAILGCSIYAFLPFFVQFSSFLWNPNFQLTFLPLLLLALGIAHKTHRNIAYAGVGAVCGFLLLFHYQAVLFFMILLVYFVVIERPPLRAYWYGFCGAVLGFLPMIIHEFRSHFYTIQTVWKFAHHLRELTSTSGGGFAHYYFMGSLFILLMALSVVVATRISKGIAIIFSFGLFLLSLTTFLPTPTHAFGMIKDWNYQYEQAVHEIIKAENLDNFAVASPTYDTTASVQYYLLNVHNVPGYTTDYRNNDYLFIVNTTPDFDSNPAYEIHTFTPYKQVKTWKINERYYLYLLKRE